MSPVRIVHGDIGSGKTGRVADWVREQALAGVRIGGILAQKTPEGRRFFDLWTGDSEPLEHPDPAEPAVEVGRFRFRQAAFDWATARIGAALAAGCSAVVFDEAGPLEMQGGGFADLLDRLEREAPEIERVLLVRSGLVEDVVRRFAAEAVVAYDPVRAKLSV